MTTQAGLLSSESKNSKRFADVFHHFGRIVPPDPYADTEQVIAQELWSLLGEEK